MSCEDWLSYKCNSVLGHRFSLDREPFVRAVGLVMPKPNQANSGSKPGGQVVTKNDFLSLAGFLQGGESAQRGYKKDANGSAVHTTAELYGSREYVAAYECFK